MRAIVVAGDSHIGPLRRGLDLLHEPLRERFVFWHFGKGGAIRQACHAYDPQRRELTLTSALWERRVFSPATISEVGPDPLVCLSLPLNTSRILRDYSWQSHVPWRLARTEAPVSDRLLEAMIDDDSLHSLNLARDLSRSWPHVAVIEAPRFFTNASYLKSVRLDVCRSVDAAYRARVREALSQRAIPVIEQPAVSISELGTTELIYDHENPLDNHHANAAYGKLVLESLMAYADSTAARAGVTSP